MKLKIYTVLNSTLHFEDSEKFLKWMGDPNVTIPEKMAALDKYNTEFTEIEIPDDLPVELARYICSGIQFEFLISNPMIDVYSDFYCSFSFDVDKNQWAYNLKP